MRATHVSAVLALLAFASCYGDDKKGDIRVLTLPAYDTVVRDMVDRTGSKAVHVETSDDDDDDGYVIKFVDDESIPREGYRIADEGSEVRIYAHDLLGAQYGFAAALEGFGFRFRHPYDTYAPAAPRLEPMDNTVQAPQIRVRGFQLHTLHPIESYFAFWEPSADNLEDAKRIIDWTVKNRGNYVQWVALDNIISYPDQRAAWLEHTKAIIAYAHERGIKVGTNIQLFGASNLQQAFDLTESSSTDSLADQIAARLPLITTQGVTFDVYHLSFGEFFNADPAAFVDAVNQVESQLRALAPQAEMHGLVHVGAEQRVEYMGQNLIYYFLVKFASPNIVPDIHTVMFYDLFEDAGLAYHHEQFDEHLAYLRERMCAGEKVSYLPETAYWVAFDNSVPQFLPLYVRSRQLDLANIRAVPGPCGTLDQHILFSSGWEWNYWLNDVTALRASYALPATPVDSVKFQYGPDMGPEVAAVVGKLMEAQHDGLIGQRLTAYLAGRDSVIDLGDTAGIVSQPDRVTFSDLAMPDADLDGFEATVLAPLAAYADRLDGIGTELDAFSLPSSRWSRELTDGFAIDRLRTRFVLANYRAALASLRGDTATAITEWRVAQDVLDDARRTVAGRHADLHDGHGRRLVDKNENRTYYQFGYLYFADSLCYWQRELDQVGGMLGQTSENPSGCFF